jgi:hypothetical protein
MCVYFLKKIKRLLFILLLFSSSLEKKNSNFKYLSVIFCLAMYLFFELDQKNM